MIQFYSFFPIKAIYLSILYRFDVKVYFSSILFTTTSEIIKKKKKLHLLQQSFDLSSREQFGTDYFSISICWVPF